MPPMQQHLLETLRFVHTSIHELLDPFPEAQCRHQPTPDAAPVLWQVIHLAVSNGWFISLIDPPSAKGMMPDAWWEQYGYKSDPNDQHPDPPTLSEAIAALDRSQDVFINLIEARDDDALLDTAPDERSHGFVKPVADVAHRKIWHDGWHSGQISAIRKALKFDPVFP